MLKLWMDFITHLVQPRKKDLFVAKRVKLYRYGNPHQSNREKQRRIRQGLAGLNCNSGGN